MINYLERINSTFILGVQIKENKKTKTEKFC